MKKLILLCCVLTGCTIAAAEQNPQKKTPLRSPAAEKEIIYLPGMPHRITFRSTAILENGTLGYAESKTFGTGAFPTQFGLIYIYGLYLPQGNLWIGVVYPTTRTVRHRHRIFPCYTPSKRMAERINHAVAM